MTNVFAISKYCETHTERVQPFHLILETWECCPQSREYFLHGSTIYNTPVGSP